LLVLGVVLVAGVAVLAVTGGPASVPPGESAVRPVADESDTETAPDPGGPADAAQTSGVVELGGVDWTSVGWTTTCSDHGELQEVTVSAGNRISDQPRVLEHDSDPGGDTPGVVYSVFADDAVYGDNTGDGQDEAVFRTQCFFGNHYVEQIEVWSHDTDGQPLHLPPVFEFSKFDGSIASFEVNGGALRVTTTEGAYDDLSPHLNGYPVTVVTDWTFQSQRWTPTEVARDDG
jgi:hypothetical protein